MKKFGVFRLLHDVADEIGEWDTKSVIEFGAGGGDASRELSRLAPQATYFVTDTHPVPQLWKKQDQVGNLVFIEDPCSFDDPRFDEVPGQKTLFLFSVFHHFDDRVARDFLNRARGLASNVMIIEPFQRNWASGVLSVAGFGFALTHGLQLLWSSLQAKDVRGFFFVLFFYFLIPAVPLMFAFDGLVSVLRQRTAKEMVDLGVDPPALRMVQGEGNWGQSRLIHIDFSRVA